MCAVFCSVFALFHVVHYDLITCVVLLGFHTFHMCTQCCSVVEECGRGGVSSRLSRMLCNHD